MWSILKKENAVCHDLRDALESIPSGPDVSNENSDVPLLSPELQAHLASCPDCQAAADARLMTRFLLRRLPRAAGADSWFAPRVMAAIATREAQLRQSIETWAVLPRLAARLTWVSALALLLMGTWVLESPRFARNSGRQTSTESLFESSQSQSPDDVLISGDRPR